MTRFRRHPQAAATEFDDEAFLVRDDGDLILRLSPTAAALWRALAEPADRAELAGLFQAAFQTEPPEHVARDVDRTLDVLLAAGMVVADD